MSITSKYKLKPLFRWCGGKQYLARKIVPCLPASDLYCEPFAGALSILLARPPARVETINDLNGDVVNFYRVLQNARLRARLIDRLYYTPYARAELELAVATLENAGASEVDRAWAFFVRLGQGFGGTYTNKSWGVNKVFLGGSETRRFQGAKNALEAVAARLLNCQIENRPWSQVFRDYDVAQCLTYLDPPYYQTAQPYGTPAFGDAAWAELRDLCLNAKGAVALSTTPNPYAQALIDAGWQCVELSQMQCVARSSASRATRLEWLLLNPRCQELNRAQRGELNL